MSTSDSALLSVGRSAPGHREDRRVAAPLTDSENFELALLRRGVGALAAHRDRCSDCRRTPLAGERRYRYEDGGSVCELCRVRRREAPQDSEIVRHREHGHAVRLTERAA